MRTVSVADSRSGDAGRAGLAVPDGHWGVSRVELQVTGNGGVLAGGGRGALAGGRGGWEDGGAGDRGADGGGPELRQGGQGSVPADRVPGPGLGLVPAEVVFPVLNATSTEPVCAGGTGGRGLDGGAMPAGEALSRSWADLLALTSPSRLWAYRSGVDA